MSLGGMVCFLFFYFLFLGLTGLEIWNNSRWIRRPRYGSLQRGVSHLIRCTSSCLFFCPFLFCQPLFHVFAQDFLLNVIPFLLFCPSEKAHLTVQSMFRPQACTQTRWDPPPSLTIIFLGKCEKIFVLHTAGLTGLLIMECGSFLLMLKKEKWGLFGCRDKIGNFMGKWGFLHF